MPFQKGHKIAGMTGKKHSKKTKKKMSKSQKGRVVSDETRKKISKGHRGLKHSEETKSKMRESSNKEDKHWAWKGENASYISKHFWLYRKYGKPNYCEFCTTTENKMYDWANISDGYNRDITDWLRLCRSCHVKFDKSKK